MTLRQIAGAGCLALLIQIQSTPAFAQAPAELPPVEIPGAPPSDTDDLPVLPGETPAAAPEPKEVVSSPLGEADPSQEKAELPVAPPVAEPDKVIDSSPRGDADPAPPIIPPAAEADKVIDSVPQQGADSAPAKAELPVAPPDAGAPPAIKAPALPTTEEVATAPAPEAKAEAPAGEPAGPKLGDWDLSAWIDRAPEQAERARTAFLGWYQAAPLWERLCWGGLAACAGIGLLVSLERWLVLGRGRVSGGRFLARFQGMIGEGKLDRGRVEELIGKRNAPATRVVRAVLDRWGRPESDLERGANLAVRAESDKLRRRVGVLRRLAAFAPLLGLLASLLITNHILTTATVENQLGFAAFAPAFPPLIAGVAMSLVFLALYDRTASKADSLSNMLDRLGAQAVDAVASTAPSALDSGTPLKLGTGTVGGGSGAVVPAKNSIGLRIEVPEEIVRQANVATPPAGAVR